MNHTIICSLHLLYRLSGWSVLAGEEAHSVDHLCQDWDKNASMVLFERRGDRERASKSIKQQRAGVRCTEAAGSAELR